MPMMSPFGATSIVPSPLWSGVSGCTRFHVRPRSSEKLMYVPPKSYRRPCRVVVRWFSQQLPVFLTTRHLVVPCRSAGAVAVP